MARQGPVLSYAHPGMKVVDKVAERLREDRAAMLAARYPVRVRRLLLESEADDRWWEPPPVRFGSKLRDMFRR